MLFTGAAAASLTKAESWLARLAASSTFRLAMLLIVVTVMVAVDPSRVALKAMFDPFGVTRAKAKSGNRTLFGRVFSSRA